VIEPRTPSNERSPVASDRAAEWSGRRDRTQTHWLKAAALFVPALGAPRLAWAESSPAPSVSLALRAEPGSDCPSAQALAAVVNRRLGRTIVATESAAPLPTQVAVTISGTERGLSARLVATGARGGAREFFDSGATCAGLAEALALGMALMLDPAEPPAAAAVSPSPRPREHRVDVAVEGSAALTAGVLETASPSAAAGLELGLFRDWALLVGGRYLPAQREQFGTGRVDVALATGDIGFCRRRLVPERFVLDVFICATVRTGVVSGTAAGYRLAESASRLWVSAGAGLSLRGPLAGTFGWSLSADGSAPLVDQSFSVQGIGVVYRPAQVGISVGLGLWARLR